MFQSLRESACKPHSKFIGVPALRPPPPPTPLQGFADTSKALQQSWLTPSLMESFQALLMSYNSQLSTVWCKFILGRPLSCCMPPKQGCLLSFHACPVWAQCKRAKEGGEGQEGKRRYSSTLLSFPFHSLLNKFMDHKHPNSKRTINKCLTLTIK